MQGCPTTVAVACCAAIHVTGDTKSNVNCKTKIKLVYYWMYLYGVVTVDCDACLYLIENVT